MTRQKPALLLDVDGVLNAFDKDLDHRAIPIGKKTSIIYPTEHTLPFMHWAWSQFDVYWCTAWGEGANEIAEWAGLPERPCAADVRSSDPDWKLIGAKDLRARFKGKIVWIEDGIGALAEAWVSGQKDIIYVHTNMRLGVTKDQALALCKTLDLSMEAWK